MDTFHSQHRVAVLLIFGTVAKATVASLSSVLQGLLLSAYLKMLLADPNDAQLRQQVSAVYERYSHFMDADLQQRAVEYQGLMKLPDVASRNVTAMPKWEKRKSLLLRRMAEKEVGLVDHVLQSWHACQGQFCSLRQCSVIRCQRGGFCRPFTAELAGISRSSSRFRQCSLRQCSVIKAQRAPRLAVHDKQQPFCA